MSDSSYSPQREELLARLAEIRSEIKSGTGSTAEIEAARTTLDKIRLPDLMRITADLLDEKMPGMTAEDFGPALATWNAMLSARGADIQYVDGKEAFAVDEEEVATFLEALSQFRLDLVVLAGLATEQLAWKIVDGERHLTWGNQDFGKD